MKMYLRLILCLALTFCLQISSTTANTIEVSGDVDQLITQGNITYLRYFLWTRSNLGNDDYYVLIPDDENNLANSNFSGTKRTYLLHPGWTDYGNTGWILDSKTSLLTLYDCNVISVDWALVVPGPNYNADVNTMYEVAELNAHLIDWLANMTGLLTSSVELTGHSLGGQSVGMTAKYVTAGRISRVTGLDPAGPLFYNKTSEWRLDESDADYVDVIHTNSCPVYDGCFGIGQVTGHADFWPNGGEHQKGCAPNIPGGDISEIYTGCSHQRAVQYWVEALDFLVDATNKEEFTSWPCPDFTTFENGSCPSCGQGCLSMGFGVDRSLTGNYYLTTHITEPFAKGDVQ